MVQVFDYSRFDRIARAIAIAECAHSATIFTSFITRPCPTPCFTDCSSPDPSLLHINPRFGPVHQIDLPSHAAQDTLEGNGRMALVPLFDHASNTPLSLISVSKTHVDNPVRGRYINRSVDSHGSIHSHDTKRLCAVRILIGIDA